VLARFKLNLPTIGMENIGAGAGSADRSRHSQGADRSGERGLVARAGVLRKGGKTVTITDCDLVLGYLNPDFPRRQAEARRAGACRVEAARTELIGVDVYAGAGSCA
jgi:N-methylhydantoinase A/oxoprolinase/acetone carboxylase beta subunit